MTTNLRAVAITQRFITTEIFRREQKCMDAVCRILANKKHQGTGFLIGRQIIITNNHVLPRKMVEDKVSLEAEFFYEKGSQSLVVKIDPQICFVTSESPGAKQPLTDTQLDFTIVGLAPTDQQVSNSLFFNALSIFQEVVHPRAGEQAYIIQHPLIEGDSTKKGISGDTQLIEIGKLDIHYNTLTAGGSSGGPVLNSQRKLYGLHRVGRCLKHGPSCNQGVLIRAIVKYLDQEGHTQKLAQWILPSLKQSLSAYYFKLAQENALAAREFLRQASLQFEGSEEGKAKHEAIERTKVIEKFDRAIQSCQNAKKKAEAQTDILALDKELRLLRWQRMRVMLDLSLPLYLQKEEDPTEDFIDFIRHAEEPMEQLEDILQDKQTTAEVSSGNEDNPTLYFILAFTYEAWIGNPVESARWFLSLARGYLKRKKSIFLVKNCLDKALKLNPKLLTDSLYITLEKDIKIKEKRVYESFDICLESIKAKSAARPTCFILHDRKPESREWVESRLLPDLKKVEVIPIYDKNDSKGEPDSRFDAENIKKADFVFSICTPHLVEMNKKQFSYVAFDLDLLMKKALGAVGGNVFAFMVQGSEAESLPYFFTTGTSHKIDALSTENYLFNSLAGFAKVKQLDLQFAEAILYQFKERKKAIEEEELDESLSGRQPTEQMKGERIERALSAPQPPSAPSLPTAISKQLRSSRSVPAISGFVDRENINIKEFFDKFNCLVLTQAEEVHFKTGKTTLAAQYVEASYNSKTYKTIVWLDARNEESIKKSIAEAKKEFDFANWLQWLAQEYKWLIVYDNAPNETFLNPYLPSDIPPQSSDGYPHEIRRQILITSRERKWTLPSQSIERLTSKEGVALIRKILKRDLSEEEIEICKKFVRDKTGVLQELKKIAEWLRDKPFHLKNFKKNWEINLNGYCATLKAKSNVPFCNFSFFGRADVLAIIEEQFSTGQKIVALQGLPGMGKTQIAAHYSLLHAREYDKIEWIDGFSQATLKSTVNKTSEKNRVLLIFDHITHLDQLKDFISETPCDVLVTLENPTPNSAVFLIPISPLTLDQGVSYVLDCLTITEEEARALVEILQRHPTLLTLAIRYLLETKESVQNYLQQVKKTPGEDSLDIMQSVFHLSWEKILKSPEAMRLFKDCVISELSIFTDKQLYAWGKAADGVDEFTITSNLELLHSMGMIEQLNGNIYIAPFIKNLVQMSKKITDQDKEKARRFTL